MTNEQKLAAHIPPSLPLEGAVEVLDTATPRAGESCDLRVAITLGKDVPPEHTVELWWHFVSDTQIPQVDDPKAPAYFDVASDVGEIETYIDPLHKVHGPGAFFPYRRIAGIRLHQGAAKGTRLRFRLQDISIQTYEEAPFNLRFTLMHDNKLCGYYGDAVYTVTGSAANHLRIVAPTCICPEETFDIPVVVCDQFGNKSGDDLSAYAISLREASNQPFVYDNIQYDSETRQHIVKGVSVKNTGVYYFRAAVEGQSGINGTSNPAVGRDVWQDRVMWGDLHQHACYLDGRGSPAGNYRYALTTACLDFCAVCPHQVGTVTAPHLYLDNVEIQQGWDEMIEAAQAFNNDNFVTILGSEVNAFNGTVGDLNSYYLELNNRPEVERFSQARGIKPPADKYDDIETYLSVLEDSNGEVLLMPHAHAGGGPEKADIPSRPYITNVEACSVHGNFEEYYRVWLRNGWRVGVHGGGDNHMPSTGNARPGNHYPNTNGLTGAWTSAPSRRGVWDAYKNRRTYAVTGNQRIFVDYQAGAARMGQVVAPDARSVSIQVAGTEPILSVELIRNGEILRSYQPHADRRNLLRVLWTDNVCSRRVDFSHTSGRVSINGMDLTLQTVLYDYSRTDHFEVNRGSIEFRSNAYSGAWRGFIASVDGEQPDSLLISVRDQHAGKVCLERDLTVSLAEQNTTVRLPLDSQVLPPKQTYTSEPVPSEMTFWIDWIAPDWPKTVDLDWEITPGAPCYVRVRQIDGNEAWSSAIWWENTEKAR